MISWIDITCAVLGMTTVVLAGRNSKYNFWVGYLYTAALFVMFYGKNLYASLLLQPVSLAINILGHYRWTHPKEEERSAADSKALKVSMLSWVERGIAVLSVLVVAFLWGWLLDRLFPADPHPYLDSCVTVLILMAHQMSAYGKALDNPKLAVFYFVSYASILIIGSIIARTTWVGAALGLIYMGLTYSGLKKGSISSRQASFWLILTGVILLTTLITAWLYNSSPGFRSNFRFGFEGFFNWVEQGTFRTDSTDKLNGHMWIWPQDSRTWAIGSGLFGDFVFRTDIGYCRFILYCGLIGITLFSLFFIYNGIAVIRLFPKTVYLSLLLIALTFIVWMKVATDIFFIYALLLSTASLSDRPSEAPA